MAGQTQLRGVFAVAWDDVTIDGTAGLDPSWVRVGAELRWHGRATRLDAQNGLLSLQGTQVAISDRARSMAERLTGMAHRDQRQDDTASVPESGIALTDGYRRFILRLVARGDHWLAVFGDGLPAPTSPLWIVEARVPRRTARPAQSVICFAADTIIATPDGPRPDRPDRAGRHGADTGQRAAPRGVGRAQQPVGTGPAPLSALAAHPLAARGFGRPARRGFAHLSRTSGSCVRRARTGPVRV